MKLNKDGLVLVGLAGIAATAVGYAGYSQNHEVINKWVATNISHTIRTERTDKARGQLARATARPEVQLTAAPQSPLPERTAAPTTGETAAPVVSETQTPTTNETPKVNDDSCPAIDERDSTPRERMVRAATLVRKALEVVKQTNNPDSPVLLAIPGAEGCTSEEITAAIALINVNRDATDDTVKKATALLVGTRNARLIVERKLTGGGEASLTSNSTQQGQQEAVPTGIHEDGVVIYASPRPAFNDMVSPAPTTNPSTT
ncbi:MAG: hypothetical protein JO026_00550 [Patescibacteria group bacterium]|nr:hypothetical protein [Patescibacteria group bacterium]